MLTGTGLPINNETSTDFRESLNPVLFDQKLRIAKVTPFWFV